MLPLALQEGQQGRQQEGALQMADCSLFVHMKPLCGTVGGC